MVLIEKRIDTIKVRFERGTRSGSGTYVFIGHLVIDIACQWEKVSDYDPSSPAIVCFFPIATLKIEPYKTTNLNNNLR